MLDKCKSDVQRSITWKHSEQPSSQCLQTRNASEGVEKQKPTTYYYYYFLICIGSSLLRTAFLQLQQAGATQLCGTQPSLCSGFSFCGAQAVGTQDSVVVARELSSCGSWTLEHRLSSCGARAQLLCGMWDLPRPGLKPVSPALAGGFLTTAPLILRYWWQCQLVTATMEHRMEVTRVRGGGRETRVVWVDHVNYFFLLLFLK